jgi:hypothetical protein
MSRLGYRRDSVVLLHRRNLFLETPPRSVGIAPPQSVVLIAAATRLFCCTAAICFLKRRRESK